ncbi:hypothetical protein Tco_1121438 [Tanacetum coccineum]|uniref:Uncharacterized protein n=1 Tax=Tanacetum coccineum TaxID=301880 RepID=A0ABQ5J0B9_9ASTR
MDQPIPDKTDHQKEVKEEDPKIVAIRERKARAAAKKREKKKRGEDEGEGSRPKFKRRKTTAARKGGSATSEYVLSLEPIRVVDPTGPVRGNPSGAAAKTAESWYRSLYISPHDSANHSVHNYDDAHGNKETNNLWLGKERDTHSGCAEKLRVVEDQNSKLYRVNKDQALRIKELEDELARKDSSLVYAERISVERAQEKEKLVTELGRTKMENFYCIHKLLPILVELFYDTLEVTESFLDF